MADSSVRDGMRGGSVTVIGGGAALLVQFASVATLSRLLEPADFGLVAMAAVFVTLGNLVRDFGLPLAALQARDLSTQQTSNLFWMNLVLAAGAGAALAAATPLLVVLYSESRLWLIIPAMSLVILISGAGAQVQVELARRMRFGVLAATEVGAQFGALLVAIAMAQLGYGYWALIFQSVVGAAMVLVTRWIFAGWRPVRFRRGHGSARLFRTGAEYGAAQFLAYLQSNADSMIIGAGLGANALGFYNRGYQLLTAPATRLLDPLTQVVVPTINRARNAGRPYEPILLQIQFVVGCAVIWAFVMAAVTAPYVVPFVLGSGWGATVGVFQILAIGGCFWVLNHVSYWAFIINELSRELLHYNLLSKPLAVACLLVGSQFGIEGVAWGYVIAMAGSWPLNLAWLKASTHFPAGDFGASGMRILLAGGVAACVGRLVVMGASPWPAVLTVLAAVLSGTIGMVLVLMTFAATRQLLTRSAEIVGRIFPPMFRG